MNSEEIATKQLTKKWPALFIEKRKRMSKTKKQLALFIGWCSEITWRKQERKERYCHIPHFTKSTSDVSNIFPTLSGLHNPIPLRKKFHSYSTLSIPDTAIPLRPFRTLLFHSRNPVPFLTYCLLDFHFSISAHFSVSVMPWLTWKMDLCWLFKGSSN